MSDKEIIGSVMVVGGGIAGIQASLDLADSGYKVYMVEKSSSIGGVMAQLDKTFPTNDCSMCVISPKLVEAGRHLNIELLTKTEVKSVNGEAGNFSVKLKQNPRYINIEKCTACGECEKICPITIPNKFDEGLNTKKAAYKRYPQAMPSAYTINKRGAAPCKVACPVNPSIQGCIALMQQGKYKEAFNLFRLEHPMPGICGRVCHHPCEDVCSRSNVDAPISIMALHRFLADWAIKNSIEFKPNLADFREEKVAVIGSGPAGLACAYFLAVDGFKVTVFEKMKTLGGMLTSGIPPYRLPRNIIDHEINILKKIGVKFEVGIDIGKNLTIEKLRERNYNAFFLAIGAQECKSLGIKGEKNKRVFSGVDFLRKINIGSNVKLGDRVAVIGGGNVALDAVRSALRSGAKNPFILYRRSKEEMPANKEEIDECLEEGIPIKTLIQPLNITEKDRNVLEIECIKMKLGKVDSSGRRRPEPIINSEFTIEVDSVISAIGQESNWSCLTDSCACTLTNWGTIKVDPTTFQSDDPDIFAGGDAVTGPATVIEAISAGKKAAKSINYFLSGKNVNNVSKQDIPTVNSKDMDLASYTAQPREKMLLSNKESRKKSFYEEVQLGFTENQIQKEIARCLSCGVCSECYQCVEKCLAGAIEHEMQQLDYEINVGAIILATGFKPFSPENYDNYNYIANKNVVTSLEFERILSASGPYQGHLVKPSNNKSPKKIAWLQCVGSRDVNKCDNEYCSSVCCMYANKQAIIAKEHSHDPLDTVIFFMDMRTFGKDFDKYSIRAQAEGGVRLVRSRIHSVLTTRDEKLKIVYSSEAGGIIEELFDIVVLSVGLTPSEESIKLAKLMNIELNKYGYAKTSNLSPVSTNREGIYVCGAFQEPKDIPLSVMEASASSASASELLSDSRWTLNKIKQLPPELDISNDEPRIGVFVCNCGINIGGVADVPAIREYASSLPHVVHVEDRLFACSQDSQDYLKKIIIEKHINRVVVASCSPRTHESLFQETIRDVGLNKYLFEMANIRDQNTWVHMNNPDKATKKAKDLVRMAIVNATHIEPLYQASLNIIKCALIVGGGIAGMEAALSIAQQGCDVILLEKTTKLGGNANYLKTTWQGESVANYIKTIISKIKSNKLITVYTKAKILSTSGVIGNFSTSIIHSNNANNSQKTVHHGVTIITTGGKEFKPKSYLYGTHDNVFTHLDFDLAILNNNKLLNKANNIVFIQCVESRDDNRPYCSKVCCTHSLKNAILLKEKNPSRKIIIVYRDIRSYGFREKLYQQAREKGILFIRYDLERPPIISENRDGVLNLSIKDQIIKETITLNVDLVVLASGIISNDNVELSKLFKLPINSDGFFVEAHAKLRPVDFSYDGIFLAGLSHYPKPLEESIAQAKASASRAMTVLSKDSILVGGMIAVVDSTQCAVCLTCVRTCPYGNPSVSDHSYAVIEVAQCHGCGICVSECPSKAIQLKHFTDTQILAKSGALFDY